MTHPWTPPEDAVCGEEGCTLPVAGVRPLPEDFIIEDDDGSTMGVLRAGENDQIVCAVHASGPQPDGSTA